MSLIDTDANRRSRYSLHASETHMTRDSARLTDRRRLLKYGGALGLATLAGCAGNTDETPTPTDANATETDTNATETDTDTTETDTPDASPEATFEMNAVSTGWEGTAPEALAGVTNPTLQLEAGATYRVIWTNDDGAEHDFVVLDDAGDRIVGTELYQTGGESHELVFEATEAMTQYYCSTHPDTMRGTVEVSDASTGGGVTLIDQGPSVGLEIAADGLASPVALVSAPGETDRRYIVDQPGQIYLHDEDGVSEFMDISDRIVELREGFDERGLLGMAFHPQFQEDGMGKFYVRYSAPADENTPTDWDHQSVLAEFEASADATTGRPDSERIVLEYPNPQFNHNAGPIAFGPDGYLYVATGDGGNANDIGLGHVDDWYPDNEGGNGQDTTENLLGGILRIDVDNQDAGMEYAIPADNPLVEMDGHRGEYYAWGFRNPWGMGFTDGGELLVADVGQGLLESVNHVEMGGNYGWNVTEGTHCFSTDTPSDPPESCPTETPSDVRGGEPLLGPIIEYPHDYGGQTIGISIVGGELYGGTALDGLQNGYVFGDWRGPYAGRLFVAHAPEGWPDQTALTEDFLDQTDGYDSAVFDEERWEGLWPIEEITVDAPEVVTHEEATDRLGVFVLGVEQDGAGDLYVLTNESASPTGEGGRVLRVVPSA